MHKYLWITGWSGFVVLQYLNAAILSYKAAEAGEDGRCQKAQTRRGGPETTRRSSET